MLNMYTETIDMVATGKRIERLRKGRGYSVVEIAQYMGFTGPQAVYKWQKGLSLPDVVNLMALGRLFGVTVEDIVVMEEAGDEPASSIDRTVFTWYHGYVDASYMALRNMKLTQYLIITLLRNRSKK